jgi:hypothetical protein
MVPAGAKTLDKDSNPAILSIFKGLNNSKPKEIRKHENGVSPK